MKFSKFVMMIFFGASSALLALDSELTTKQLIEKAQAAHEAGKYEDALVYGKAAITQGAAKEDFNVSGQTDQLGTTSCWECIAEDDGNCMTNCSW